MTSPSGEQIDLRHGDHTAVVTTVGATLRTLEHARRPLVQAFGADEVRPRYRGAVLAPWPNRVVDGRWTWAGEALRLDLSEPARGHALHGLVLWAEWSVTERGASAVTLAHRLWPSTGYPFALDLAMTWSLSAGGLTGMLRARNAGRAPAPYGCAIHPYLVAGDGVVDDWTLHLPAMSVLAVDERLAPTALGPVPPELDFRAARRLGAVPIDHAYTGLAGTDVTLTGPDGRGVRMSSDLPWVQVRTADLPADPAHSRRALAVEPMTCPPDAFNSGTDLVVLEPGAGHEARWRIAAV